MHLAMPVEKKIVPKPGFEELMECMQKMNAELGIGNFTRRHVEHYLQRFDTDEDKLLNQDEPLIAALQGLMWQSLVTRGVLSLFLLLVFRSRGSRSLCPVPVPSCSGLLLLIKMMTTMLTTTTTFLFIIFCRTAGDGTSLRFHELYRALLMVKLEEVPAMYLLNVAEPCQNHKFPDSS